MGDLGGTAIELYQCQIKLALVPKKQSTPIQLTLWQNASESLISSCILGYPFFLESRMIPIDMKRLIKKTSNPVRKKIELTPPPTEPIEIPESQNIPETVIEPNPPVYIEDYVSESEYISEHYRPRSVGNSGWQPSDVWRELRVDDFCRG
ncbi:MULTISPECIES: hypothetical protein [Nostoc]|uniref:Uncharacterized protein n=2 Tax=Nostoc TaxID=1177 RepID=A0ABR8IHP8_9NOSO|nr:MULTISPECIES: hypothetical protein [Nostoc]MBD2566022.1 hypothetical protein [Nostoc linckia FACHB-391]MBD2651121.1 hypothetical protein [Nostoc foliaceum FACHB-393]